MAQRPRANRLVYLGKRRNVRKAYLDWRLAHGEGPERCDNSSCLLHSGSQDWNGKKIRMVLDHKNGVNGDNRPKNLRFLCPNCNSQLSTHGGGNKGRVEQSSGGFSIKESGTKRYELPIESGDFSLNGKTVRLSTNQTHKNPSGRSVS